jgi:hypothetical protein
VHLSILWAGAFIGLLVPVAGCTTTTAIRPDQLPILTNAAVDRALGRRVFNPLEVIGSSGEIVRVEGTLERVEVTMGPPPGGVNTFDAPVASELRGPALFVRDEKKSGGFLLPWIQDVNVTYANKAAEEQGGVVLITLGALFLAGGTAALIGAPIALADSKPGGSFLIAVIVGVPLLHLGGALLVPGVVLSKSGGHRPKYPPRPISVGPRGLRVSF